MGAERVVLSTRLHPIVWFAHPTSGKFCEKDLDVCGGGVAEEPGDGQDPHTEFRAESLDWPAARAARAVACRLSSRTF